MTARVARSMLRACGVVALALLACSAMAQGACTQDDWFGWIRAFGEPGTQAKLDSCLAKGAGAGLVDAKDEAGCPAVVVAALNENLDAIKFLAKNGADLDASCHSGSTALMHAAGGGHLETVVFLHEAGVDLQAVIGAQGWTAITYAARHGQMDVLTYLHKLDLVFGEHWSGSALMWAAAIGDSTMLKQLIEKASHVPAAGHTHESPRGINDADAHGFTAMHWAVQKGQLDSLVMLQEAGANLEAVSNGGLTALMTAAYFGHHGIMAYLLDHESAGSVDVKDKAEWTAIMWAAAGGDAEAVASLYEAGACTKPKQGGWDPLMIAARSGHHEVVEWLLAHGAPHGSKNHADQTAGDLAHSAGHAKTAELLNRVGSINSWHEDNEKKDSEKTDAQRAEAVETQHKEKIVNMNRGGGDDRHDEL